MAVRVLLVVTDHLRNPLRLRADGLSERTRRKKVGDSAEVDLQPEGGSGTRGTATFSKAKGGGVKVVLKVRGLPGSGTMYLAHVHPGTCAEEEKGGGEQGHSHHQEHGASARGFRGDRVSPHAGEP